MSTFALPFEAADYLKPKINIGATLDIPTGKFQKGRHGEMILNAGLAILTGVVGIGNGWKSGLLHYMTYTALARIKKAAGHEYDTETNTDEPHLTKISKAIQDMGDENVFLSGRWMITDKKAYSGNVWYEMQREFLEGKIKDRKKHLVDTPFLDRDGQKLMQMMVPTLTEVDSLSDFETDDVISMHDDNELGESGGNTIHMRQGLAKLRFLMEATRLNPKADNYLLMTAQMGKESEMQRSGGGREVPIQKLKYLKNGDKIKGVTDKFTFLMHNCWHSFNLAPLIDDGSKGPKYPRHSDDKLKLDTDLNSVQIRQLRGKSGPSGMALTILCSQESGLLPSLTEFEHIKNYERYGLEGNNTTYSLNLLPNVTISRTTVRGKIDSMYELRRALNITSEMCQMSYLWHDMPEGLMCSPKELYDDLIKLGYDWDMILKKTRGWWTLDNDRPNPYLFLSTYDLLNMRVGKYHPFWLEADKKTIKKEYQV